MIYWWYQGLRFTARRHVRPVTARRGEALTVKIGFSVIYCFLYNGRQNMNLAISLMMDEFGLTKADMGIVASALFWCYGFGHLFSGRLGELIGNKRFIFCGVVLCPRG